MAKEKEVFDYNYCPEFMNREVFEKIKQRRRQMFVHSFMYYRMGCSIVDDKKFDGWAYELKHLQEKFKEESRAVEFYNDFADWDGTTGFHLPYYPWVERKAKQLIEYHIQDGGLV